MLNVTVQNILVVFHIFFLSLISIFIYVGWHRKESSISVVLKIFGIIFLFFGLDSLSNQGKIGQVIRDMDLFIGSPGSIIISLGLIIGGITLSSRLCWMKLINHLIMKIKKNELERVGLDNDITYNSANINKLYSKFKSKPKIDSLGVIWNIYNKKLF